MLQTGYSGHPLMLYYLIAAGLMAHAYFWGLGLAGLALPRVWRPWWWVFAPGFGLALQSAVVWYGAHTTLAGTNSYAVWSELLPAALLGIVLWRQGWGWLRLRVLAGWPVMRGIGLLFLLAGGLLLWPMAQRGGWTLTSSSLGSCDQADYAAGARVLQEFSKAERGGFLGLSEVTRVGTAETFFEFWLRLNHFTPSAVIAHEATVFGLLPYQLVSVTGVVLLLLNAPLVFFLGRIVIGLRGTAALVPAAIYLFSPLGAYAVHQGALGQLYAAHGIALLTLMVFGACRARLAGRGIWPWAPLGLVSFWLLAGAYNFILTVALAPALAWLLGWGWLHRDGRGLLRIVILLLATLAACAVLFGGRFDGLIERFQLFQQYDFGWPVPVFSPAGWLGLLADPAMHGLPQSWRLWLSILTVGGWLMGIFLLGRRRDEFAVGVLALVFPVLIGWGILVWESRTRINASYDAFKFFSVFYPGFLVGLTCWLAILNRGSSRWRAGAGTVALLILAGNLHVAVLFARDMRVPPLRVEHELLQLSQLESMPGIESLNLRIEDFWSRLWANALLLRKPQYFPTHTYEGRLNTALRGEWNLSDSLLRSVPVRQSDYVSVNAQFHAVRVMASGRVDLSFGRGWYELEGRGPNRWRWSSGLGAINLFNPGTGPQPATFLLKLRAVEPGEVRLLVNGTPVGVRALSGEVQQIEAGPILLPRGESTLTLQNDRPIRPGSADDERLLGVALYELIVQAAP